MFSPKFFNQDKDNLVSTVFSELKILGVKLPKSKKFKTSVLKSDKTVQDSNCKIFGVNLSDQEWVSNGEYLLPKFLAISTAYLERFSKNEIGLFRKAGNVARQKKLRMKLEEGEGLKDCEPNDVASLLKQWLRELPEPLIPPCLQDLFLRCLALEAEEHCVTACLLICLLLTPEQLHTFKYLLNFMDGIASNCDKNKMDSYNLALIMAPNIFASHESSDKISNTLVKQHTSILKKLIENCYKIGEIPPGVTFQYPSNCSELDSSSDVLDSNANKSKKKLKTGPVQEIFIGFKKFVGQNNTPLSKNVTPEPYLDSFVTKSACKRKVEHEQYITSAVKRQAVSKEELNNHELDDTPKRNGLLINTRDKNARAHVRRKSIGALLRRKDKKNAKSSKLPSKKSELESLPVGNIATAEIPIINIIEDDAVEATINTEANMIHRSESIKKSWSDNPLPLFSREFSLLPIISVQSSEGCLSGQPRPRDHPLKLESLTTNKNILCEKDIRKNNSESKKQKNVLEDISKEEMLLNTPFKTSKKFSSSNTVEINHGRNENSNLDTRNDSDIHPRSSKRSSHISASVQVSSTGEISIYETESLDKENSPSECITLQKVGLPRQEAFIMKNVKHKAKNSNLGLENLNNQELSDKNKTNEKRNSLNHSLLNEVNSKQENRNASGRKSLKRKTRHGSLIRGQPNSVKSGLRLALPRHCPNNSSFLLTSPTVEFLKNETTFKKVENCLTESPLLQSLDLSLSSLLQNFCLSSPNDLPEFTFSTEMSPDEKDSATKLSKSYKSNSEETHQISPKVLKIREITPPLKQSERLSSKSDSKLRRKKTISKPKRSDTFTCKQFEYKNTVRNKIIPKVNSEKVQSPLYIKEKMRSPIITTQVQELDCSLFKTPNNKGISPKVNDAKVPSPLFIKENMSPIITAQVQGLECNLFKTPNNKCSSPNSEVWISGSTFLNNVSTPPEEASNKRESIAMILKNNTGHVQAKVNLYDNNLQRSGSKDSNSHEKMLRTSQKSSSASKAKTPVFKGFDSSHKTSSVKNKTKYQRSALPPPPKFTLTDLSMSPKANQALKEVTNFNLEVNGFKLVKANTPIKNASSPIETVTNTPNSDHKTKKTKRNSFSGHTPYKLSKKVARSESSPACQRSVILRD